MPLIPYDETVQGGVFGFSLPPDHPFERAFEVHDSWYDQLIDGTSPKTLKQIDKEFYWNCMRIAASEAWLHKDMALGVALSRHAWMYYRLCRIWANLFRNELENYKPK